MASTTAEQDSARSGIRLPSWRTWHVVAVAVCVGLVVLWAALPSEWSLVDDPLQKQALVASMHGHGALGGVLNRIGQGYRDDLAWGLFRPVYWVYCATFYLLNPALAHGVRAVFFLVAVLTPAVVAHRRSQDAPASQRVVLVVLAVAVTAANSALYEGLSFLSLQELTGLALVGLGLALEGRPAARSLAWIAAAWLKAPFVWLVVAWGVVLLVRRRWRTGVATLAVGLATVVTAAWFAHHGSYTTNRFTISLAQAEATLRSVRHYLLAPAAVMAATLVALRATPRRWAWRDGTSVALVLGGLGYLVTMLPWGYAGSYYPAPFIWMLTTGALLAVAAPAPGSPEPALFRRERRQQLTRLVQLGATAAAVGATVIVSWHMVRQEYDRNAAVVHVRDWESSLPPRDVVIGVNGIEAADRFTQIQQLRDPAWADRNLYVDPSGASAAGVAYYVTVHDQGDAAPPGAQLIHKWAAAAVYRMPAASS